MKFPFEFPTPLVLKPFGTNIQGKLG